MLPKPPRRLRVFAILAFVFGGLGLVMANLSMLASAAWEGIAAATENPAEAPAENPPPAQKRLNQEPAFLEWRGQKSFALGLIGLVGNGLLVAAGVRLWQGQKLGVTLYLWQSVISFVLTVGFAAVAVPHELGLRHRLDAPRRRE